MVRIAIVDNSKLKNMEKKKYILSICPGNRMGLNTMTLDAGKNLVIDEKTSEGCTICAKAAPDAIKIINLPERLDKEPVFRYGQNQFELFRIPVPQKNLVVGILGANGIGKTTAMEILAGLLKPNFGDVNKKFTDAEIIQHFRGTELQTFFSRLLKKDTKVSYKPQYVDRIPKQFRGTASALLGRIAQNSERIANVTEQLQIQSILDRSLDQLSGGELQKTAIAATILKEADLYLFDEPSSYLDIKERVRVAKIIRELAKKKTVLVIEHDLIILDFLADLVHIMYGEEGAYGVVSHPLSSKEGVNAYLGGFLRDENTRFRDKPIRFETAIAESVARQAFVKWPELNVRLGDFNLKIEQSELYRKEVVGVIGANGTGKTTFARILAGQLRADKKVDSDLRISYKPQYISSEDETQVLIYLTGRNKNVLSQENKLNILRPLDVERLLEKNLNELSGGELQRVMIAACLLNEAGLYLLDEPSTYLDVEQRLSASKAIQRAVKAKEAAALVIDHDLLFTSYLADRVLVFSGQPGRSGIASGVKSVKDGMNLFLKELDITLRRDPENGRPRVNKPDSQKDKEQKNRGNYYEV